MRVALAASCVLAAAVWLAASLCSGPPAARPVPVREGRLAGQPAAAPDPQAGQPGAGPGRSGAEAPAGEPASADDAEPQAAAQGMRVTVQESPLPVEQSAAQLLEGYRAQGACALAQAGWLDLLGNVWGCTVVGGTWTDLCVVRSKDDGTSELRVVRMEGTSWEGLEGAGAAG